ncbi:phage major capsid protein [uncultured Paraglaciecola sp.]|uniref:phage major capsid protein n=1 Tax=uncultured Paraglaciecola sp. TaxID=1765024 RepID=UPI0026386BCC|nr:phage major capsid protein [uncultured Paraglaciecola sp.]
MDAALRKTIDELGGAVEEFKSVQKRVETLETEGKSGEDVKEQLAKYDTEISKLSGIKSDLDKIQTERIEEKKQISEMTAANEEFEKQLEELAKKGLRPNAGDSDNPDVEAYTKAYGQFLRKGRDDGLAELHMKATNTNTLLDPDGGFAVPEEIDRAIIEYARQANPMRQIAATTTVSTPDYKKLVNIGKATSGWVGETDGRPETESPKLAQLPAFMGEIYANPASTQTALDDIFFDAEAWLAQEVAIEFAEQENDAFTNGNGVNKPKGILDYATAAVTDKAGTRPFGTLEARTAAAAGTVGGDDLIDLVHAARPAYRGNGRWMMSNLSIAAIRKLKDADGNYLWRPGLEEGVPDRLLGYSMLENENVPDITAGAGSKAILFGDFARGYLIVDRIGTRVLRDPYTNKPYVMFYTTKRVGAMGTDSLAIKVLEMA